MPTAISNSPGHQPFPRRAISFARFDAAELALMEEAARRRQVAASRRELVVNGAQVPNPLLILHGWAYRSSILADGRRQIIHFLLPGDLIAATLPGQTRSSAVTAMTPVEYCVLPAALAADGGLSRALETARETEARYLDRQITRLGRLNALERLLDWLLDLRERLIEAGVAEGDTIPLPLTQEVIADALGLTSVHVNRTLQTLRRDDLVRIGSGRATFVDRARCELLVGDRH